MSTAVITETKIPNFINGEWVESPASEWMDVLNPATGENLGKIGRASCRERV